MWVWVCAVPVWANCKLQLGWWWWWGDGECAGMRAEALLSLGMNSDRLVVGTEWFFLPVQPAVRSPSQDTLFSQTHDCNTTRTDRHSSGETEETEGQGVSLPFLKDSSVFYHPKPGDSWKFSWGEYTAVNRPKQLLSYCSSSEISRQFILFIQKWKKKVLLLYFKICCATTDPNLMGKLEFSLKKGKIYIN